MHQFAMLCKQLETPFSSSWSRYHHTPSTQVNLLITSTHGALQRNMLLMQGLAFISTRDLIVALDLGACCTNKGFKWPFTETQRSTKGKRKIRKYAASSGL